MFREHEPILAVCPPEKYIDIHIIEEHSIRTERVIEECAPYTS